MSSSTTTTNNSLALQDIILSIAGSLNDAQEALRNKNPYDEYGRPNTLYQVPYLDFNLEVISQFETPQTGGSTSGNGIRFAPFRSTETTTKNQGIITSNISGRFVAVMPNEGSPQVFLKASHKNPEVSGEYSTYTFTIQALQANSEPAIGQPIEINFDAETSYELNAKIAVMPPVFLDTKEGYISAPEGVFYSKVRIKTSEFNLGRIFVFKINSGTQVISTSISKT